MPGEVCCASAWPQRMTAVLGAGSGWGREPSAAMVHAVVAVAEVMAVALVVQEHVLEVLVVLGVLLVLVLVELVVLVLVELVGQLESTGGQAPKHAMMQFLSLGLHAMMHFLSSGLLTSSPSE